MDSEAPHWDRYVILAVMAHNTTYPETSKCLPLTIKNFSRTCPVKCIRPHVWTVIATTTWRSRQQNTSRPSQPKIQSQRRKIFSTILKKKEYYEKQILASQLEIGEYVVLLNPKYINQSDGAQFKIGPVRVMKVSSRSNYIIGQIGAQKTQCVHRMCLRPVKPQKPVKKITVNDTEVYPDPDATDDIIFFNNKFPSRNLTEADNTTCNKPTG